MPIRAPHVAAVIGLASLLGACATSGIGDPVLGWTDNFGEANRHTMAAQIIDPLPVYDSPATSSGEHAAQAVTRYRTDKVKKPERLTTSTVGGTSSSAVGSAQQ